MSELYKKIKCDRCEGKGTIYREYNDIDWGWTTAKVKCGECINGFVFVEIGVDDEKK